MAGIVGLFANIGSHIPVFKKEKLHEPNPEGTISTLHYRATTVLIIGFSILVTATDWISGISDRAGIISCLHKGAIPDNVINTYCYIMGTFTVPRHYVKDYSQIGGSVVGTGVGPYDPTDPNEDLEFKAYYQWVPFVLFLQGIMFYLPHLIYKDMEGGKLKKIIFGLNQWICDSEERHGKEKELAEYIVETLTTHKEWCWKLIFGRFLYLVNVIGQIFFTDCFLGWEFTKYGFHAASFLEQQPEDRIDPMSRVFPRMTKCTFQKYGPSGTIQRHDAQCILPINIINEKIYVFLWFWFCFLSFWTITSFMFDTTIIFARRARRMIIQRKLRFSPVNNKLKIDVKLIVDTIDYGDWKLIYHILRNMDPLVFSEFCEHLTDELRNKDDDDSCLKLKDVEDSNENLNKSYPDKGDFITLDELNDGNYVKAPSPTGSSHKESQI